MRGSMAADRGPDCLNLHSVGAAMTITLTGELTRTTLKILQDLAFDLGLRMDVEGEAGALAPVAPPPMAPAGPAPAALAPPPVAPPAPAPAALVPPVKALGPKDMAGPPAAMVPPVKPVNAHIDPAVQAPKLPGMDPSRQKPGQGLTKGQLEGTSVN